MNIGHHLRSLREQKGLSQGDVEKRSGLLRPYISRIEHGHTIPSLETLEKFAQALEIPLYVLFIEPRSSVELHEPPKRKTVPRIAWRGLGREERFLRKLYRLLSRINESDRRLLLEVARKMAQRRSPARIEV